MGFGHDSSRDEVLEQSIAHGTISVGTSPVEVKAGATKLEDRKSVIIYNDSSSILYMGQSDVTVSGARKGTPIYKKQIATFPLGNLAMYIVADSASNNAIITELG